MRSAFFLCALAAAPVGGLATVTEEVMGLLAKHLHDTRVNGATPITSPTTTSSRSLQDACTLFYEYLIYFNTSFTVTVYDDEFEGCSISQQADISQKLTEGFDGVVGIDPRLEQVVSLETAICDPIPTVDLPGRGDDYPKRDDFQTRQLGSGFGFNWDGGGRCRYCPPTNGDQDFRSRRFLRGEVSWKEYPSSSHEDARYAQRNLDDEADADDADDADDATDEYYYYQSEEPIIALDAGETTSLELPPTTITNFALYNSNTGVRIKTLYDREVIDVQFYGYDLTIVAEYTGEQPGAIGWGFDDDSSFSIRTAAPFSLEGGSSPTLQAVPEILEVGTHFVAARPYDTFDDADERDDGGDPYSLFFLVIDGQTNAAQAYHEALTSTETNTTEYQALIDIIEDDVSHYLSQYINKYYFHHEGSCLYRTLAWVKVDIVVVEDESDAACLPP